MIYSDYIPSASGTLHLRAVDIHGTELWRKSSHNMIVAGGRQAMSQALAGLNCACIKSIAAGDNGTDPAETDTKITNAVTVEVQKVEFPAPGIVRFHFTFGYNVANNINIREFGLITVDGRLFSRKVRESIEKTEYMSIVGQWDIDFNSTEK